MAFTFKFIELLFWSLYLAAPLMLFLAFVIVSLGLVVGRIERWQRFDALYWAFITATTVGYGDIRPLKKCSRVLSIFIALTGIMFTGILVAMTLNTAGVVFKELADQDVINHLRERF